MGRFVRGLIQYFDLSHLERIHFATGRVFALRTSRNNRVIERFFGYFKQVVGFGRNLAARFLSRLIRISNDERPPIQVNLSEQSLSGYEFFWNCLRKGASHSLSR
jgi:ATP phosphoribosyltransferase regulatory subunit HisZ